MMRVCPNGHKVRSGQRCRACDRMREATRATPTQRGYDAAHRAARRELAATLPAPCGYCGVLLHGDEPWVAAHVVDGQPEYGYVVAHGACNERAKHRVAA